MADPDNPVAPDPDAADDPFLERRLASLGVLPVPDRPPVGDLRVRSGDDDSAPSSVAGDRRRSHRVWLVASAAAAVLLVAISIAAIVRPGDERGGVASGGLAASIAGREFWSTSVRASLEPGAESVDDDPNAVPPLILRFVLEGQRVNASAGCNSFTGSYAIDGDRLVVGELGGTEIGCFGPAATRDAWLTDLLTSSPSMVLDGDRLTLTSGTEVIELLDRRAAEPDLPLTGTSWQLTTIVEGDMASSASPPAAAIAFAARPGDPSTVDYAGNDGCTTFGGSIRTERGDVTMVEWFVDDSISCPYGYRDAFAATLRPGLAIAIEGSQLTLTDGDRALVFRGAAAPTPSPDAGSTVPPPDPGEPTIPATIVVPARLEGTAAIEALLDRTWELEAVEVDGIRTSAAPPSDPARATLTFTVDPADPTWVAEAYDGCNGGGGRAVATGTAISFGGMGWEERACPGIDDGVVAMSIHTVLLGETTYETDGETLTIRNGDRALVLRDAGP